MELRDYLTVLRRYWISIVAVTLAGIVVGVASSFFGATPSIARSAVFVSVQSGETAREVLGGATFASSQVRSYALIATRPLVLQPVIDELGLPLTPDGLAKKLDVQNATDSMVITIAVTEADPELAARIAQAVADQLVKAVASLSPKDSTGNQTVVATVVGSPTVADGARSLTSGLRLGLLVGLILALGQALVRLLLDRSMKTTKQVERAAGKPVLATVPFAADPLAASQRDAYRRLRTNIDAALPDTPGRGRSLVVTSGESGEGATTTAINLATVCAAAGRSVLLVDANLHQPQVSQRVGLETGSTLSSVLSSGAPLDKAAQSVGTDGLRVLGSQVAAGDPADLLATAAMSRLLDEAVRAYDYVILDAPAVSEASESAALASLADGAVLVVGAETATAESIRDASDTLALAGVAETGVVLNHLSPR